MGILESGLIFARQKQVDCVIRTSENNTHVALRWVAVTRGVDVVGGSTLVPVTLQKSWSTGLADQSKSKRGTAYAAEELTKRVVAFWIHMLTVQGRNTHDRSGGYVWNLILRGHGKGRAAVVKILIQSKPDILVSTMTDGTPIPHNGCRPKKARRV
jgi:ribosomal protein S11